MPDQVRDPHRATVAAAQGASLLFGGFVAKPEVGLEPTAT
jgi:hypothetical protein